LCALHPMSAVVFYNSGHWVWHTEPWASPAWACMVHSIVCNTWADQDFCCCLLHRFRPQNFFYLRVCFRYVFTRCWGLRQGPGKYFWGPGKFWILVWARTLCMFLCHYLRHVTDIFICVCQKVNTMLTASSRKRLPLLVCCFRQALLCSCRKILRFRITLNWKVCEIERG